MPNFLTIGPANASGYKPDGWAQFLAGGYVAVGWLQDCDLTGRTPSEIAALMKSKHSKPTPGVRALGQFLQLRSGDYGDYVAANNVNFGLFGIGKVTSPYRFVKNRHNDGGHNPRAFWSHCFDVQWLRTDYLKRQDLLREGEKGWPPFGAVGTLGPVPDYISRALRLPPSGGRSSSPPTHVQPDWLREVIAKVQALRSREAHTERDHEELVRAFFEALGYSFPSEIQFQSGRIDIRIVEDGRTCAVIEVTREWNLSKELVQKKLRQAGDYAGRTGARFMIVTNGDDYCVYDRKVSLSFGEQLIGRFRLTELQDTNLEFLERLRRGGILSS